MHMLEQYKTDAGMGFLSLPQMDLPKTEVHMAYHMVYIYIYLSLSVCYVHLYIFHAKN